MHHRAGRPVQVQWVNERVPGFSRTHDAHAVALRAEARHGAVVADVVHRPGRAEARGQQV